MKQKKQPVLAMLGMPIGNPDDITFRQYQRLIQADLILCEEFKTASRLLKHLGIRPDGRLELLNEHNESSSLDELIRKMRNTALTVLMSDAGMPAFCDPGSILLERIRDSDIKLEVVPGPTALTAALSLRGIGSDGFYFAGFPPRKAHERGEFIKRMCKMDCPVAFYETPYRTGKLLGEIQGALKGSNKKVFVAIDITSDKEYILDVPAREIDRHVSRIPKGPPVILLYAP